MCGVVDRLRARYLLSSSFADPQSFRRSFRFTYYCFHYFSRADKAGLLRPFGVGDRRVEPVYASMSGPGTLTPETGHGHSSPRRAPSLRKL